MISGMGDSTSGDFSGFYDSSLMMFYLGIAVGVVSWVQVTLWSIFAQRIAFKVKYKYFYKCMHLDAGYYDVHNPGEMSSKIAKETSAIQRGLGEKVGQTIMSIAMVFFGFGFAFTWGWEFSVVLLGVIPVLGLVGVGLAMSLEAGVTK